MFNLNTLYHFGLQSILFAVLLVCMTSCSDQVGKASSAKKTKESISNNEDAHPLLRHVVLFKFKPTVNDSILNNIENSFSELQTKIPEIIDFEWGTNNSPEGLDKGFTHCFFVSFKNEEARATYLPHPAHQEFVAMVGPFVEDVTVIDYWVK